MAKLIKQRQKNDCVIAAIAMVVRTSYSKVRKICGPVGLGLYDHEVIWLINNFGDWRITYPRKNYTVNEWSQRYPNSIVKVGYVFDKCGHALAIVDGEVLDPSGNIAELNDIVCSAIIPK